MDLLWLKEKSLAADRFVWTLLSEWASMRFFISSHNTETACSLCLCCLIEFEWDSYCMPTVHWGFSAIKSVSVYSLSISTPYHTHISKHFTSNDFSQFKLITGNGLTHYNHNHMICCYCFCICLTFSCEVAVFMPNWNESYMRCRWKWKYLPMCVNAAL